MKFFLVRGTAKISLGKKIKKELKNLTKLHEKFCILYTAQFYDTFKKINKIFLSRVKCRGQMTGCAIEKTCKLGIANSNVNDVDAIICVCDGLFHPISIAKELLDAEFARKKTFFLSLPIPIYIFNPFSQTITRLEEKEIVKLINLMKARWLNFNLAKNFGIIVSIKLGQENFDVAVKIKELLEKEFSKNVKNRKDSNRKRGAYLFLADMIDIDQLQDFCIDFWINTACPAFSVEENTKMCNTKEFFIFLDMLKKTK